jgi:hypothetical protein
VNKTGEILKFENFGNFCLNVTLQYHNWFIISVDVVQGVVMCVSVLVGRVVGYEAESNEFTQTISTVPYVSYMQTFQIYNYIVYI